MSYELDLSPCPPLPISPSPHLYPLPTLPPLSHSSLHVFNFCPVLLKKYWISYQKSVI